MVDAHDLVGQCADAVSAVRACRIQQSQKRNTLEFVVDPERVVEVEAHGANAPWAGGRHCRYFGPGPLTTRTNRAGATHLTSAAFTLVADAPSSRCASMVP